MTWEWAFFHLGFIFVVAIVAIWIAYTELLPSAAESKKNTEKCYLRHSNSI